MANLREQPLRLESALTRDYINQAAKMREIEARVSRDRWHPIWQVFGWVVVGIFLTWALMSL